MRASLKLPVMGGLLILTACVAPVAPTVTDQEREDTRRSLFLAMVKPEVCYQNDLQYAVRDSDFLDRVLVRQLGGKKLDDLIVSDRTPTSRGLTYEIARLMREAPSAYAAELRTADGLARIEKIIDTRFAHPRIEMTDGIVVVDYGHVAAKLMADGAKIGIDFSASPHLNREGEWHTAEVAAAFDPQLERHPNARGVRLRIQIPGGSRPPEWFYEYTRAADRVRVFWGDRSVKPLASPPLGHDFAPYRNGSKSLSTNQLQPANP